MKLIQIYECLCDETRLRIIHLLSKTSLCVTHLQEILKLAQVKVSKHLAYMKERGMVEANRRENRMIYSLSAGTCSELDRNLKCLQECIHDHPIFQEDLDELQRRWSEVLMFHGKPHERSLE